MAGVSQHRPLLLTLPNGWGNVASQKIRNRADMILTLYDMVQDKEVPGLAATAVTLVVVVVVVVVAVVLVVVVVVVTGGGVAGWWVC